MPRKPRAEYEITAVDKTQKAFASVQTSIEKTSQKLRVAGGIAGAVVAGSFGAFANQALTNARELDRMSKALDINVEQAQKLEVAFRRFGLRSDDVSDAMNTLTDRAEDAKDGMKSFADDFRLVGLEVDDLRDKDPVELFEAFADAVSNTTDVNKRNSAVVRILGDDLGNQLLPVLKRGSEGFKDLGDEAERAGRIMSEKQVKATVQAERSIDKLIQTIQDRGNVTFANWAGTIDDVATAMNRVVNASQNLQEKIPGPMELLQDSYRAGQEFGRTLRGEGQTVRGTVDRSGLNLQGLIDQATTPRAPKGADLLVTRPNAEQLGGEPLPRERFFNDPLGFNRLSMDEQILQRQQRQVFNFNSPLSMQQQGDLLTENIHRAGELTSPMDPMIEATQKGADKIIEIEERMAERREKMQEQVEKFKLKSEESIKESSLKIAHQLAAGNEDAQKAIFAIQKAVAVGRTIVNTNEAGMLAYASQLIPGDPSSVARAEAARQSTLALGYTQAGFIAAASIGQLATSGGGGGGGATGGGRRHGAPGHPNQNIPDLSRERLEQEREPNVRIIVQGDINGNDADRLFDQLKNRIEESDAVLIEPRSRNGRELRSR